MTDTPWTPGPWTARTNLAVMQGNWDREQGTKWDRGKPRPEHATNAWVSSAGEKGSVATVFGTNCEANLALIVAAPDLAELVEDLAHEVCGRMKDRPDAPTCRSPIPAEAIPRDRWCQSCRARDLIAGLLKEDA